MPNSVGDYQVCEHICLALLLYPESAGYNMLLYIFVYQQYNIYFFYLVFKIIIYIFVTIIDYYFSDIYMFF